MRLRGAQCQRQSPFYPLNAYLDVTFNEDASRIRKDNAPVNFAILRRMALNILSRDKTVRASIAMKRYRAALDNNYLAQVIAATV